MIGSIASLVPQVAQANAQADDAAVLAQYHFLQQLRLNAEQHEMKLRAKATMFKEGASLDRQLHLRTMAHELNIARREGVRDVWKARNDTAQTLMIVESVFLAFVFEIIVGARIPEDTPEVVLYLFSGLLGSAVTTSMIGIILLLVQHHRLAQFDFTSTGPCDTCDRTHPDLNDFFDYHCRAVDNLGRAFFAAAVSFSLLTSCVYGVSKWMSHFDGDVVPGVLFCVPLVATVLFVWFSSVLVPEETVAAEEIQPADAAVSFRRPLPHHHPTAGAPSQQQQQQQQSADDAHTSEQRQRAASVRSSGDDANTLAGTVTPGQQQRSRTNSTFTEGSSTSSQQRPARRDFGGLRSEADEFHRLIAGSFRSVPPNLGRHSSMPVPENNISNANSRSGGSGTFPEIPEWRLDGNDSDGTSCSAPTLADGVATPRLDALPALEVEAPSCGASVAPSTNREDDGKDDMGDGDGAAVATFGASRSGEVPQMAFAPPPSGVRRRAAAPPPLVYTDHHLHHHDSHQQSLSASGNLAFPLHDDDIDRALMDMDTIDVGVWDGAEAGALPTTMSQDIQQQHQQHQHQEPWSGYDALTHEMQLMSGSGPPSRMRSPSRSGNASPTRRGGGAAADGIAFVPTTTYLQAPTPQLRSRRRRSNTAIERRPRTRFSSDNEGSLTAGNATPPPPSPLVPASIASGPGREFQRTASARSIGGDTSAEDGFYTPRSYDADDDDANHAPF